MLYIKKSILLICLLVFCFTALSAQKKKKQNEQTQSAVSENRKSFEGFFNFYIDSKTDKLFLEIKNLDTEFLYVNSLATGVGSNDIGLDRGQLGRERVVKFVKAGNKIMLHQPNYDYRAVSDNPDEVASVAQAFASSILWAGKIVKQENGTYTVDATDFFMQDTHNVSGTLKRSGQGNYSVDKNRSAFYLPRTKSFPKNTEFEVTLTFRGTPSGGYIRSVVPSPESLTVRQHHSFIALPDSDYTPRKFDPRGGFFGMSYYDYATPISEKLEQKFIARHRLKKKNPELEMSEPIEPIVYYLDRGAPEPIRSALMEGASWWNQAFEAAGYKNAFIVKLLPEDADPMDVRYNLIQWVHRSTRGWSYGGSISDPRTGEIIKGHVSLGSLRVRQDFLIATGLIGPYGSQDNNTKDMQEMALARLRQLSAHEVGHTIGLAHSYTSSAEGRASVMDYPHPLAKIVDGKIDLSDAYDDKIGAWDKVAVAFGYQDFPEGVDEKAGLEAIIQAGLKSGITFLSDQDARPQGSAHPYAHLWDNGTDVARGLEEVMQVRALALKNFGTQQIRSGENMASLEEVLTPVYFYHRYQVEAAVKVIGGLEYRYAKKGDGQFSTKMVDPAWQKASIDAVLKTISVEALTLDEKIIAMIPPRPMDDYRNREIVKTRTGLTFDPIAAAESSADLTMRLLLNEQKAARMIEYHARNVNQPGFDFLLNKIADQIIYAKAKKGLQGEVQKTTRFVYLNHLMRLATSKTASNNVKALVYAHLEAIQNWSLPSKSKVAGNAEYQAHLNYVNRLVTDFITHPDRFPAVSAKSLPDGSPIGTDYACGH